jgi:2,3-bisphosphoglycerate-independent phosphoglycerate mutase
MSNGTKRSFVLAILDGWGYSTRTVGNPMAQAQTPTVKAIMKEFPTSLLQASGLAVGMVWGETGNSEVGHLNLGGGRIVEQYYSRINRAIKNQTFYTNPALVNAFSYAAQNHSNVHIVGLLTTNTVHAAFNHIIALAFMSAQYGSVQTYFHLFLDGRDSGLQEGLEMLKKLTEEINKASSCKVATIIGRDLAMDRDNNWDRIQKAHELLTKAIGESTSDLFTTIQNHYKNSATDSNMPPIVSQTSGFTGLHDKDSMIFFNFREDSMRQLVNSFADTEFNKFPRTNIAGLYIATMTRFLENPHISVAIPPPVIKNSISEVVSSQGLKQLHIAETDKYAHVTYFFNGLHNEPFAGEDDIFIESVKNIEEHPQMSSAEIADKTIEALENSTHDFIVINFANADLLAHTGNYNATVKGIEAVDVALDRIIAKVLEKNHLMIVTADHGNAEKLTYTGNGEAETKHDDSPVFLTLIANEFRKQKSPAQINEELTDINGILPDVAPTILQLMGIPQPVEMTGMSLMTELMGDSYIQTAPQPPTEPAPLYATAD